MSFAVVNGATCMCSFGAAPCTLIVDSVTKGLGSNLPIGTIMDNKVSNLPTFGMCSSLANPTVASATSAAAGVLTPQPCAPALTAPWVPGSPTVLIENRPALNNTSKLICTWGGIIQITNPGQISIQFP